MATFESIHPEALADNPFKLIGKDWMLVTSANPGTGTTGGVDYNTMTASWGGVGVLWSKPVAFIFIRPQRHTFGFSAANSRMTLSFFDEDYRPALAYCGRESGRDGDKAQACGLTPVFDTDENGRAAWFDEARLVLKVHKLYEDDLRREAFLDDKALGNYEANDFHKVYVCAIDEVLVRG